MRPFFYLLFAHPEVAAVVGSRVVESVITDTIKHHPALFIFVAAMVIGVLYFSYSTFALKADLKAVEVRIAARLVLLEINAEKRDVDAQIRALDAEVFELERIEKAQQATRRDMQRLWELKRKATRLDGGLAQLESALRGLKRGLDKP